MIDIAIIGAGPAGLSAATQAKARGLSFVLLEEQVAGSVLRKYHEGKEVADFPPKNVAVKGELQFKKTHVEALERQWRDAAKRLGVHEHEEALAVEKRGDGFVVRTPKAEYGCAFVIVAVGMQGKARKLCVPGDERALCELHDPSKFKGKHAIVVGGGDSAIEAAVALDAAGASTILSYRKPEFFRVNPANLTKLKQSKVRVVFESTLCDVGKSSAIMDCTGKRETVPADAVFTFIGGTPSTEFLRPLGLVLKEDGRPELRGLETSVPGVFAVGDLSVPPFLIKHAINDGFDAVEEIAERLRKV